MSTTARISLPQYELMIKHGVFDGKYHQRVELIRGELRQMNPIGHEHATVVDFLNEWSFRAGSSANRRVRIQHTILLPDSDSAPEPDVAWVPRKKYTGHPTASDVLLLIEVADSTLSTDCGEKAALYAESGIQEYWVVDIQGRKLLVYRDPTGSKFDERRQFLEDESIAPICDPAAQLRVSDLFSML